MQLRFPAAISWAVLGPCIGALACDPGDAVRGEEDGKDPDAAENDAPPAPRNAIDLLFVIDNSGSMAQEQAKLANAMLPFLDELTTYAAVAGVDLDLHVGVVSTDVGTGGFPTSTCANPNVGDDGCLRHGSVGPPSCAATYPAFLSLPASPSPAGSVATLAADFACIGTLGTDGCGFEQPLESARRALLSHSSPDGCNEGFLRPGSVVGVILLTDENDCSAPDHPEMFDWEHFCCGHCFLHPELLRPPSDYAAELLALEAAGHAVVMGIIAGTPPGTAACEGLGSALGGCLGDPAMEERIESGGTSQTPSCSTTAGYAFPPRRLVELALALGPRAYVSSICAESYDHAMTAFAALLSDAL